MKVDPGRPARIARVNFGLSVKGADKRREIKACNEFPSRATRRNTGLASWRERCEAKDRRGILGWNFSGDGEGASSRGRGRTTGFIAVRD